MVPGRRPRNHPPPRSSTPASTPSPCTAKTIAPKSFPRLSTSPPYWYRTVTTVPASYAGRHIWLNFDGINYTAIVWVNGTRVGDMRGAFARGHFDISANVKPGAKAAIAVLITPQPHPGISHEHTIRTRHGRQRRHDRPRRRNLPLLHRMGLDPRHPPTATPASGRKSSSPPPATSSSPPRSSPPNSRCPNSTPPTSPSRPPSRTSAAAPSRASSTAASAPSPSHSPLRSKPTPPRSSPSIPPPPPHSISSTPDSGGPTATARRTSPPSSSPSPPTPKSPTPTTPPSASAKSPTKSPTPPLSLSSSTASRSSSAAAIGATKTP